MDGKALATPIYHKPHLLRPADSLGAILSSQMRAADLTLYGLTNATGLSSARLRAFLANDEEPTPQEWKTLNRTLPTLRGTWELAGHYTEGEALD